MSKKKMMLRFLWLLLYPAAAVQVMIAQSNTELTEDWYASRLYPVLSHTISNAFAAVPFSCAELILCVLVILTLIGACLCVIKAWRRKLSLARLLSWTLTILTVGGIGVNAFYWLWGFNYYRSDLGSRLGIDVVREVSAEELRELCFALADTANTLRDGISEDESGVFVYDCANTDILASIPAAYDRLAHFEPLICGKAYKPKAVAASRLMSKAGIAGIFIPFTEEANVNTDCPPLLVAASAAHETAHYLGVAREDEANFVAFLACAASNDPQVRYSGYMLALIYAGNALSAVDPAGYSELWNRYSEDIIHDLENNNDYVAQQKGAISEAANDMNNTYLKSNSQSSGTASYGEMVTLLAAYAHSRSERN